MPLYTIVHNSFLFVNYWFHEQTAPIWIWLYFSFLSHLLVCEQLSLENIVPYILQV